MQEPLDEQPIFDDPNNLLSEIKDLDENMQLNRNVANSQLVKDDLEHNLAGNSLQLQN